MKNVLALDLDTKRYDGDALAVRRVDAESESKYADIERKRSNIFHTSQPPLRTKILDCVSLVGLCVEIIVALFVLGLFAYAIVRVIFYPELENGPNVLVGIFFGCCLVGSGAFGIISVIRLKRLIRKAFYSRDLQGLEVYEAQWALQLGQLESREKELFARMREEIGLPDTAIEIDAFTYCYQIIDGKRKYHAPAAKRRYISKAVKIYADSEALFLATESTVFRIPFSDSMKLVRIEKQLGAYGWNKQEQPSSEVYKQYKFLTNRSCALLVKECCALQFHASGEDYEILFPPYEYETISRLTGRTAEPQPPATE